MREIQNLFQKTRYRCDAFLKCQVRVRFAENSEAISKSPIIVRISRKVFDGGPDPLRSLALDIAIGMKSPAILALDGFRNSRHPLIVSKFRDVRIDDWIVGHFPRQVVRVSRA